MKLATLVLLNFILGANFVLAEPSKDPNFPKMSNGVTRRPNQVPSLMAASPAEKWRVILFTNEIGNYLGFAFDVGKPQPKLFRFDPEGGGEVYIDNSAKVVQLKNSTILVSQWNYGKSTRVYVFRPLLYLEGKNPVLFKKVFDAVGNIEPTADQTGLIIEYGDEVKDPGKSEADKIIEEKTLIWRPGEP